MGVKAEHRFIGMSRRHFDEQSEANRRDPWNIIRNQEAAIRERDETIKELRGKIEALGHDMSRAKCCIRVLELSRTAERQERRDEYGKAHQRYMDTVKAMFRFKRAWEELSQIVRTGMTPEQYHQARETCYGDDPDAR